MKYKTGILQGSRSAVLPYVYCSLLLVLFACLWSVTFAKHLVAAEDGAAYYILGKALYLGEGYVSINTPVAVPANSPPPGYPLIVALTMALWSSDFAAVKAVNGVFLMLSIVLLFFLFAHASRRVHLAFVAALAVLCNAHLLNKSMVMMSESAFLFFSTATLLLFTRLPEEEDFKRPQIYLLLFCLVASYYIRTMGLALVAAVCLELAWQRRWKYLGLVAVGYVLAALPWYGRGRGLGGNAYVGQLLSVNPYRLEMGAAGWGDLAVRFYENVQRYVYREIPDGLLYYIDRDWAAGSTLGDWSLGVLLTALAGYGLHHLKAYRRPIAFYLASTGGVILLWPQVWPGTRFLQPIIPLLLLAVCNGLYSLLVWGAHKAGRSWNFHPLMLLPLLFIYSSDIDYLHRLATQSRVPDNWIHYFKLAEWAKGNTEPEAIVACRKPILFHLYSDRRTVHYEFTEDSARLLKDLEQKRVDYVVLDRLGYGSTARYLVPAVMEHEERFSLVHKLDDPPTWLMVFHRSN